MADAAAPAAKPVKPMSLHELRAKRKPLRNIHKEVHDNLKPLDRLALFITNHVGTMGFFLIIFTWTVVWLGWNLLAPEKLRFDPGIAFVLYLFISNVIQILLMPLIMVGQNIQGAHSEARAQHDLDINIKAEQEIETVLAHLEYQNQLLLDLVTKLDVNVSSAIKKREADTTATKLAIQKLAERTSVAVAQANAASAALKDSAPAKAKVAAKPVAAKSAPKTPAPKAAAAKKAPAKKAPAKPRSR